MMIDAPGLLLVIDRLGRTIAELEAQNVALEQIVSELQKSREWPTPPPAV